MTVVTFVFIGIYDNPQLLSDNTLTTLLTLDKVKTLFVNFGFNSELINKVNFMCDSKNIKHCNIELINGQNYFVQVFSTDTNTKQELKAFYNHYKGLNKRIENQVIEETKIMEENKIKENRRIEETKILKDTRRIENINTIEDINIIKDNNTIEDINIIKNNNTIEDINTVEDINTIEEIAKINQKIKSIFSDKDFILLVHIYKNRPELLKLFYQFISSSDIIDNNYSFDIDIKDNLKIISDMNLNIPHENITQALYRTKNHLNLALRYLLFNN